MATNCWSAANIDGAAAASVPRTGEIVQASWSRSAMTRWKAEAEMTMAILRRPAHIGDLLAPTGAGPVLLLLGPLMWFGIVYRDRAPCCGRAFIPDDFTMSVTSDFRWQPARCSTPPTTTLLCGPGDGASRWPARCWRCRWLGMARYQRQNEGLLYIAVMLPMWASISSSPGAAAGERWRGAVVPRSS
ncbi:hypothetical protein BANRA_05154 [Klebsiella pneumoniae]|nr:hypothetical protein BANRA_05154 [Klebsiella pneumoniae]